MESTIRGTLGYDIFATNDASAILGGNPYDNSQRVYAGSADDLSLNRLVERIHTDPKATQALLSYQASGELQAPLVAIHTTGDEIVPFFHMDRYRQKVDAAGRGAMLETITVERYGHCNFTGDEVQNAFNRLVQMVRAQKPTAAPMMAPSATSTPVPTAVQPQTAQPRSQSVQPRSPLARLWSWVMQSIRGLVQ